MPDPNNTTDSLAEAPVAAHLLIANERCTELLVQHLADIEAELAAIHRDLLAGEPAAQNRFANLGTALARAAAMSGQLTALRLTATRTQDRDAFTRSLAHTAARHLHETITPA